jgi:hypothetical protein
VNVGKISTSVLLSFLIIMLMTVIGCGHKDASSSISGDVTGNVTANVLINLTGDITSSTTTDAGGNFSFGSMENGYYTVTPYLDGYTFSPASNAVTVSGASVTGANFISTFTGYSVSGNVTGAVTANVTIAGSGSSLSGNVTTASDGSYSFPGVTVNGSYNVKPSLKGYKFTPYYRNVTVNSASVTGINFVSSLAHIAGTAKGTYTWDSTTDVLTINWTSINYPCYASSPGTSIVKDVTITTTTMTWPYDHMIWTRASGTPDDPTGTWTATDILGNSYTAEIKSAGSISMDIVTTQCSSAMSEHFLGDYIALPVYLDPTKAATSVSLTGPGISTTALTYNTTNKAWELGGSIDLGATPALPDDYKFTITDSGTTTWVENATISCFVQNFATNLSPSGTISDSNPTFSWTAIIDDGALYKVRLYESGPNLIWISNPTLGTSMVYNGSTALTSGSTYSYVVDVQGTNACKNGISSAIGNFTYSP